MLQGVIRGAQQCHVWVTPKFSQGGHRRNAEMLGGSRPPNFHRGHTMSAVMPCKAHPAFYRGPHFIRRNAIMGAPPPVLFGANLGSQQCRSSNAPREGPSNVRRDASIVPPFPASLIGAVMTTQQCQNPNAPMGEQSNFRRNASKGALSQPFTGGLPKNAAMPCNPPPHPIWATHGFQKCH